MKPPAGFVAGRSVEDVSKRTAHSKAFRNPDGSMTAEVSAAPLHFRRQGGGWENIDNTLIHDGDGTVRNRANSFVARFGAANVRLETQDGVITMAPTGSDGRPAPVVDAAAATVTYPNVWSGVDLRYRVENTGIKEELVVRSLPSTSEFAFRVRGTSLAPQSDGGLAAGGAFAGKWRVSPPIVLGKDGRPLPTAAPRFRVAGEVVTLAVSKSWLASLGTADFPVVIDPTWNGGGYSRGYFGNSSGYETCDPCQVAVGKPAGETRTWRSTVVFPYEQAGITGSQLVSARVLLQTLQEGTTTPYNISVYGGDVNGSYGGDWNWINLGQPLGSASAGTMFDFASSALTTYYRDRLNSGVGSMPIKFVGDEANPSYKRFIWFQLFLDYNPPPPPPNAPPNMPPGASLYPPNGWVGTAAPPLIAGFSDDDDTAGSIEFEIAGVGNSIQPVSNGEGYYATPNLGPGTYSWRARGKDAQSAGPWTSYRSFTINSAVVLSDDFTGSNGAVWNTTKWATTANDPTARVANIQGNQGQLGVVTTSSRATAKMTAIRDSDVTLTYRFGDRTLRSFLRLMLRASGATGSGQMPTGYRLELRSDSATVKLQRCVNSDCGSGTSIASFTYTLNTDAQNLRYQVMGNIIRVKLWAVGTAEPALWQIDIPDPNPDFITTPGVFQVVHNFDTGPHSVYVDNLVIKVQSAEEKEKQFDKYESEGESCAYAVDGGSRTHAPKYGRACALKNYLFIRGPYGSAAGEWRPGNTEVCKQGANCAYVDSEIAAEYDCSTDYGPHGMVYQLNGQLYELQNNDKVVANWLNREGQVNWGHYAVMVYN